MRRFVRPKVVSSRCMEFDACRYDGRMISSDFVRLLKPFVDFQPVCPEFEIGLGVPRAPIRIVKTAGASRLVQPSTDLDITEKMVSFTGSFLSSVEADGFILKSRSPSCGIKDVRIYQPGKTSGAFYKSAGFFGAGVLKRFAGLPVEDEGRLRNLQIRNHFLTRLYTIAAFREVKKTGSARDLVRFHTDNKMLLLSHHQEEAKLLGRIVANHEHLATDSVMILYGDHLGKALSHLPRCTTNINVLMHAMGYFSDRLSGNEKEYFLEMLKRYRAKKIPLSAPASVIRGWIARFDDGFLRNQTFFEPYPEELVEICGMDA